jgi:hypothetical protein
MLPYGTSGDRLAAVHYVTEGTAELVWVLGRDSSTYIHNAEVRAANWDRSVAWRPYAIAVSLSEAWP